jgi:hypothetical protein
VVIEKMAPGQDPVRELWHAIRGVSFLEQLLEWKGRLRKNGLHHLEVRRWLWKAMFPLPTVGVKKAVMRKVP